MKRDDLRNIEGEYLLSGHPVTDDELVEVVVNDPDLMAKVLGGGRWVRWCVTHEERGIGDSSRCNYVSIPETEGGTK